MTAEAVQAIEATEARRYLLGQRERAQRRVRAVTMISGFSAAALVVGFGVLLAATVPAESDSAEHAHAGSGDSDMPGMHAHMHGHHAGMETGAVAERLDAPGIGDGVPSPTRVGQPAVYSPIHTDMEG